MMDNKINFYGFETGVLLEKLDKEFDHYACSYFSNKKHQIALIPFI